MTKQPTTLANTLSNLSAKTSFVLWFVMVAVCCLVLLTEFNKTEPQYNAGLLAALEINSPEHQAAIALGQNYQNKLLVLVGDKQLQSAASTASDIRQQLQDKPWLESIYSNPLNAKKLQQLITYYGASPFSYLAVEQKKSLQQAVTDNQAQPLTDNFFALLNQWSDPIVSQSLEQDATLTLAAFLKERLLAQNGDSAKWQFSQQEFMLKGDELNYIPIFITIKASHLNIRDSVSVYLTLQEIKTQYSQIGTTGSADSEILMTGMLLHSASASLQAHSEISSFGLFSLIGVMLLIVLAFRALTPLIASLAVIGCALLLGIVALTLLFDAIHLLAFVFAISILGIAVDYGFHVLVLRQHTQESALVIRQKVFLPLTIALASTIAGYSLFFTTPIELLHQVVVFVGFGLVGAYLSALLLLPHIRFKNIGTSFAIQPKQHLAYLVVASLVLILSASLLNFDDSIGNLNTKAEDLVKQEQKVASLTGETVYPHMVIISAETQDALLTKSQALAHNLREQGAVLKSIADWQLAKTAQQKNIDLVKANWQLNNYQDISPYLADNTIESALLHAEPIELDPAFISQYTGVNITEINEKYWTALLLNELPTRKQQDLIEQALDSDYVNLPQALSQQLSQVRTDIIYVALPATLVILVILSLYFGFASALVMLLVPVVSSGLALAFSQLFQASLNIFNVLACLLIITLAIDYMVFFRAHGATKIISHTISLSAISSALTFGVMSFSTTPAVSSFGLTLLFGISLAWLLSHLTPLTNIKK